MAVRKLQPIHKLKLEIGKSWEQARINFIEDRKVKNCSENTIEYYNNILKDFYEFCLDSHIECPEDVYIEHIKEYIIYLKEEKENSVTSINIKLRGLRAFFYYMQENSYISHAMKIKQLKEEKKIIQTFSDEQIKKLIEKPDLSNITFAQYRDYCMVAFLLGTGVRLQTLRNIRVADIDFKEREILLCHTKAKKQQIIPLSKTLYQILQEYVEITRLNEESYLFCTCYGEILSKNTVNTRIKEYCSKMGVNDGKVRCSPHTFRHTFAKQALMNGMDLFTLQKILGHSSLDMVRRYVNLLTGDLKKNFTSPLDVLSTAQKSKRKSIKLNRLD